MLHLLSLHSGKDLTPLLAVSELQEPYALPSARIKFAVGDRYANACSYEGRFDVSLPQRLLAKVLMKSRM